MSEPGNDETSMDDHEEENIDTEGAESSPVLTINIQSWATPVVALVMLVIGLLAGFYGRPLLEENTSFAGIESPDSNTQTTSREVVSLPPTPTKDAETLQTEAEQRAAIMDSVVSQVRHFRGSPDAPITLVEFSDFQ
jgi:hypothetical protein